MSKLNTGACRFCGQTIAIETEESLTSPQLAEEATMRCTCEQAVEYQKEKQRKEKALKNVSVLFGQDAAPEKRVGEEIVSILSAAVEEIYTVGLAKVTLNLRGGGSRHRFLRMPRVKSMWNAPKPRNRN